MIVKIAGVPVTTQFWVTDALHKTPHKGIDLALSEGSPLYAIGRGVVEVVDYGGGNIGKGVILKLQDGTRAVYGHLSNSNVKTGDVVEPGQLLAYSGNTGRSTGPHLHFSLQDAKGNYINPSSKAEAVLQTKDNLLIPNAIENKINQFQTNLDNLNYWLDSANWIEGLWKGLSYIGHSIWNGLDTLFSSGTVDVPLIVATMGGVILIGMGANWPKRYLFWGWVIFWAV